jgi:glycosyltransferase involved in cell wall biosynthesis
VHLAIKAVQEFNKSTDNKVSLKIAGKHYSGNKKDTYWQEKIEPELSDPNIEYVGFLKNTDDKQKILEKAKALIIPSIYDEPFGMVMIEALACGTPIIGLDSGAIPEIINNKNGILIKKFNDQKTIQKLSLAINRVSKIDRRNCRDDFEQKYTSTRMAKDYLNVYEKLVKE